MEKSVTCCNKSYCLQFFATGLTAGIAIGVLLAPKSGAATRKTIGRKLRAGEDWIDHKVEAAEEFLDAHKL